MIQKSIINGIIGIIIAFIVSLVFGSGWGIFIGVLIASAKSLNDKLGISLGFLSALLPFIVLVIVDLMSPFTRNIVASLGVSFLFMIAGFGLAFIIYKISGFRRK